MINLFLPNRTKPNQRYISTRPRATVAVDMPTPDVTITYSVARGFSLPVVMPVPAVTMTYTIKHPFAIAVAMPTPDAAITYEVRRATPFLEDDEMSHRTVKIGTTSLIVPVHMRALAGTLQTGLAHTDVTAYYVRDGQAAAATAISLSAGAAGTWSSGGWVAQGTLDGVYQLGIPNAALLTGATGVKVYLSATGCIPQVIDIELVAYDPQSSANLGLSALPTAADGAVGGLPVLDANSKVAATVTGATLHADYDAAKTAASAANLAIVDGIVDDILVDTATTIPGLITASEAKVDLLQVDTTAILAAIAALQDPTVASIVSGVLAGAVDGAVTVSLILKRLNASVAGNIASTGTDPIVNVYKADDDATTVMTHSIPAGAASRTVTLP